MRRYVTDRLGLISSVDVADALRRAAARDREAAALRALRDEKRARRRAALRNLRGIGSLLSLRLPNEPNAAH
jgi:hypothetical protein